MRYNEEEIRKLLKEIATEVLDHERLWEGDLRYPERVHEHSLSYMLLDSFDTVLDRRKAQAKAEPDEDDLGGLD